MTHRTVSSDQLRHLIQVQVINDPSSNHLGSYPSLHIVAIPGKWGCGNWDVLIPENVKEPMKSCITKAVQTLQREHSVETPFLGGSAKMV